MQIKTSDRENALRKALEAGPVETSAPCRVDMGGTLDISTFYFPLRHLAPCTFNIALAMRTNVTLMPVDGPEVRISSRGFEDAVSGLDELAFDHPLGLISAIGAYFRVPGIQILIESSSPPRSALGGSSSAAVALVAAFFELERRSGLKTFCQDDIPLLAHGLEQSVAGVPCGLQDHLAAFYGGINSWRWTGLASGLPYERRSLADEFDAKEIDRHLAVAYCGIPHESRRINSTWVDRFIAGRDRRKWSEIIECTKSFVDLFSRKDFAGAGNRMNQEVDIRLEMTPHVLDETGHMLVAAARESGCGARFAGAGGGGCIWAVGEAKNIAELKKIWKKRVEATDDACLLDTGVSEAGTVCY
ncbi:MAG: galactokinase [Deltaproteobacteria bacterium]|nr:galactokinase [Deltaproteobacteria bacterium]